MSSLVSGIAKVFASVGTGVAATLGSAVRGVGATLFTGMAATGTAASGVGSLFGQGTMLGNLMNGVGSVLGAGPAGIATAAAAAPAAAGTAAAAPAASGFSWANLLGTGTAATSATTEAGKEVAQGGLGSWLGSQGFAGAVMGAGAGIGAYMQSQSEEKIAADQAKALREKERRITEGYDVPQESLAGGGVAWAGDPVTRPTPTDKYRVNTRPKREIWTYDPSDGHVKRMMA
jgi:hypothetical protein